MNPAALSADFRNLFPGGVVAAELRVPGDVALLLPAEAACLGRAVQTRVAEFAAGRLCARRVLAELGIVDFALLTQSDRQPVWPATVVGSITHTRGLCAAVAAERAAFAGLGVDSEVVGGVKPELWRKICVRGELTWLRALPAGEQAAAAALIFAAKEAFYKCQYPLTGEFLNFRDVRVEAPQWNAREAGFTVHAMRDLAIAKLTALPLQGRYRFHEGYISAAVSLAASVTAAQ